MIPDSLVKRVGFPAFPSDVDEPLLAALRPAGFKDVEREILPLARLENTDLREDREAVPGSGQERFEFGAKFPRAGITVFPDIGSLIEDGQPNGAQTRGQILADPALRFGARRFRDAKDHIRPLYEFGNCPCKHGEKIFREPVRIFKRHQVVDHGSGRSPGGADAREKRDELAERMILPGITRDTILRLLEAWNVPHSERKLSIDEVFSAAKNGTLNESFASGTAAVISPVGAFVWKGETVEVNGGKTGPIAQRLYNEISAIQNGRVKDEFGWTVEVK